jgi:uncharacterized protein YndB with AHSA1/START domain
MADFSGERTVLIQAPVRTVYDYVSDFPRHIEWNHQPTKMTQLTDGPVGVGSTFRTVEQPASNSSWFIKVIGPLLMSMMGSAGYTEAEITALEPDRRVAWKAAAPHKKGGYLMKAEWEIILEPQGEATHLTQRFHYMPQTKMGERIDAESSARNTGEEVEHNLNRLKSMLEAQNVIQEAPNRAVIA